jgi:thermostable 8-oxoguanine DNA glycosylase
MIYTAKDYKKKKLDEFLKDFTYQPELTNRLDNLRDEPFSQEIINEIVLWKINRYAQLPGDIRKELHELRSLRPEAHKQGETVLLKLLNCGGVDLPMASTILRFQNADVFQIIDRHAYRAVFGVAYPLYPASSEEQKVSTYFNYLDALHELAKSSSTRFRDLDRILYIFDKKKNGSLKDKS